MFQLWKLVLLCGLVSGTSAGIIHALGEGVGNIVYGRKTAVDNGLGDIPLLQSLRVDDSLLQYHKAREKTIDLLDDALSELSAKRQELQPLVWNTFHLNVSLDFVGTVQIETDPTTGDSKVVMTECHLDPESLSFTLLGEQRTLVNKLSGTVSSFLSDTVSSLVQRQVSSPLLGAQSQAWWGQCTFTGLDVLSGPPSF
ncbi:PREDICTED: BPI fold-containing family A member 2-like [Myotis davidii]|uniref:BPI fold-containing family A member 2-like n=1 Tax=Myotis davidii TaxID=225400 RepID=UPI0007673090|nr:PREDICTED: BPI fold-containing family A member 2-like [Myotis davidii]